MSQLIKILHLEDDLLDSKIVNKYLNKSGINYIIESTDNKTDFIKKVLNYKPDIILSDHFLNQYNSREALLDVQKLIDIPFILVTGHVSEEFAAEILKLGAFDYILKDNLSKLKDSIIDAISTTKEKHRQLNIVDNLRKNVNLFNQVQEFAGFCICLYNKTTKSWQYSEKVKDVTGYDINTNVDIVEFFKNVLTEKEQNLFVEKLEKEINKNSDLILDLNYQFKTKNYHLIARFSICKGDAENDIIVYFKDQSKLMEISRSENIFKSQFLTLLEYAPFGYVFIDKDDIILALNEKAANYLSHIFHQKIFKGKSIFDYCNTEDYLDIFKKIKYELKEKCYLSRNLQIEDIISGKILYLKCEIFSVNFAKDTFMGSSIIFHDISDEMNQLAYKKELISKLSLKNKNLEQFNYLISHNLRSPITTILGFCEFFHSNSSDYNIIEKSILGIEQSALKLDSVIYDLNSFLDVLKNENHDNELIHLENLAKEVYLNILEEKCMTNFEVNFSFDLDALEISSSRTYLFNIFYQLIFNAYKFKKSNVNSKLKITSIKTNQEIKITFEDNGIGFDVSKNRDKLFGLYKRFHSTISSKGVGLFLVKTQVDKLGGRIEIDSSIGIGTTVNLYLSANI